MITSDDSQSDVKKLFSEKLYLAVYYVIAQRKTESYKTNLNKQTK